MMAGSCEMAIFAAVVWPRVASEPHRSRLTPLAQQVVIMVSKLEHLGAVAQLLAQFEDSHVQFKQHAALPGVAYQALRP